MTGFKNAANHSLRPKTLYESYPRLWFVFHVAGRVPMFGRAVYPARTGWICPEGSPSMKVSKLTRAFTMNVVYLSRIGYEQV